METDQTIGVFASKQLMDAQGTLLAINGPMSQSLLIEFGAALKARLQKEGAEKKIQRKIFSVFIEQMQNLIRYSDERDEPEEDESERSWGVLLVGKKKGVYYVKCGNLVSRDNVPAIKEHLNHIRSLDETSLKAFYHQVRRGDPPDTSKGAGLGLIEMARMSTSPLAYAMDDVDEQRVFFSTCVFI